MNTKTNDEILELISEKRRQREFINQKIDSLQRQYYIQKGAYSDDAFNIEKEIGTLEGKAESLKEAYISKDQESFSKIKSQKYWQKKYLKEAQKLPRKIQKIKKYIISDTEYQNKEKKIKIMFEILSILSLVLFPVVGATHDIINIVIWVCLTAMNFAFVDFVPNFYDMIVQERHQKILKKYFNKNKKEDIYHVMLKSLENDLEEKRKEKKGKTKVLRFSPIEVQREILLKQKQELTIDIQILYNALEENIEGEEICKKNQKSYTK